MARKVDTVAVTAFINLSLAYEEQELWEYVEESCSRALDLLPPDETDFFEALILRRIRARMGMGM
jgi:hypothetical protein